MKRNNKKEPKVAHALPQTAWHATQSATYETTKGNYKFVAQNLVETKVEESVDAEIAK